MTKMSAKKHLSIVLIREKKRIWMRKKKLEGPGRPFLFKMPSTPHPPVEHLVDFFNRLGGTLHCWLDNIRHRSEEITSNKTLTKQFYP